MDATLVIYTGVATPTIPISPGQTLQTILQNIDAAINNMNPAPDYSGYNLYCVTQVDGVTHPTNTQNFSEGISKILCDLIDDFTDFTGTTYPADQTIITNAINAIQDPALTYNPTVDGATPFGIVNTDNIQQYYAKLFTGLDAMIAESNPAGADWAALSVSSPTNVTDAFDEIITVLDTALTDIANKQDQLPTIDNSANCLSDVGGTSTDTVVETVGYLTDLICTLPKFDPTLITWDCVSTPTDLQEAITNIVSLLSVIGDEYVISAGTGLTTSSLGSCSGKSVSIDTTWTGLYKVGISSTDAGNGNADFLENKITSLDGSITIDVSTNPDKLDLSVTVPANGQVLVNAADTTSDYLAAKIPSAIGDWGIGINSQANASNSQLILAPTMSNPDMFINNFLDYLASDPDLLAKFCAVKDACAGCLCSTVTDLVVTFAVTDFVLNWTPAGGSTTTQVAKYRQSGTLSWLTGNFTPANLLTNTDATTNASGLNMNTIYDFQIDSNCPGDVGNGNITQAVIYADPGVDTVETGGVIKATMDPFVNLDTVDFRLTDNAFVVLQNVAGVSATNPMATFSSVSAGTYYVEYRLNGTVNGITERSSDPNQNNAWYISSAIIV